MATMNPLEQKARSSFFKGLAIALLIGILVAGFLGMQIFKMKGEENQRIAAQKDVLILSQSVKSGDEITSAMFTKGKADANVAPSTILTVAAYNTLSSDENGNSKKVLAKIDIDAKTIVTSDMLVSEDNAVTSDLREQEYNMIVLPTLLATGDTIDVRLRLPNGVDYIVVSKKKVTVPNLGTTTAATTITMELSEGETLTMSAAIIDAYKIKGSKLYANKYTDPGIQTAASLTYVPSAETVNIVNTDENQVATAKNALIELYNKNYNTYRKDINSTLSGIDSTEQKSGVESGTSSETSTQQSQRKSYLESLAE